MPLVTASSKVQSGPPQLDANGNPPPGYVIVPGGYWHESCVHEVPNFATVDQQGNVIDKTTGKIVGNYGACAYPPIKVDSSHPTPASAGPLPTLNGWVEWAVQTPGTGNQFNALENDYHVPPAPSNYGGQTDFYFPGFQPQSNAVIIQTVLQYGPSAAGGGNYWSLAAWWVAANGNKYYSPLYTGVQDGDLILNDIYIQSYQCNGICSVLWNIYGEDENTQYAFGANLYWDIDQGGMWYATPAVLEAYNVTNCNQLPTSGNLDFYDGQLWIVGSGGYTDFVPITYNCSKGFGQNSPACGYSILTGSGGSILYWTP
jgi:hypothetical protein